MVILVGGFEGTFRARTGQDRNRSRFYHSRRSAVRRRKIYTEELNHFEQKYAGLVEPLEYEQINTVKSDWHEHATDRSRWRRRSPSHARFS